MENSFVTGCDKNTEWQLEWFIRLFREHNPKEKLIIADFGMKKETAALAKKEADDFFVMDTVTTRGWFLKPKTLIATRAKNKIWIDTDCEVLGNLSGIWNLLEPDKLNMVEDRPWTKRRGGDIWHNSGIIGVIGNPVILHSWAVNCDTKHGLPGDQEVLHAMVGGNKLKMISWINSLPHKYNTLRLDFLDNINVKNPLVVHHTGEKGNLVIKKQIKKMIKEGKLEWDASYTC